MTDLSGIAKLDINFSEEEVKEFFDAFQDYTDWDFQQLWALEDNAPWLCEIEGTEHNFTLHKGVITIKVEWDNVSGYWWEVSPDILAPAWSSPETLWDDLEKYVDDFWNEPCFHVIQFVESEEE